MTRIHLHVEPGEKRWAIFQNGSYTLVTSSFTAEPHDAERLVACWNALEGIPTEHLTVGKTLAQMYLDAHKELQALREVMSHLMQKDPPPPPQPISDR
jgi:hypothetical protein